MAKVPLHSLSRPEQKQLQAILKKTFRRLQERSELDAFLLLALSESEHVMLARRIQVALSLMEGRTHPAIAEKLHVGYGTVREVDRWLGEWNDYRKQTPVLIRTLRGRSYKGGDEFPDSFRAIRRKYPLHFLLINLLLDGWDEKGL